MVATGQWSESYEGGSAKAENEAYRAMAERFAKLIAEARNQGEQINPDRPMFAKTVLGIINAQLQVDHLMPADLAVAHFHPGAILPAIVRFANASSVPQVDFAPDLRGMAVRLELPGGACHDLTTVNHPVSFARDGREFMSYAIASMGARESLLAQLADELGRRAAQRIAATLRASLRLCSSLALEEFWSLGASLWGERPARFSFTPMEYSPPDTEGGGGSEALRLDLAERLSRGDLHFRLALQRYVNEKQTPIEDASVLWEQAVSPPIEIATLVLPRQDILEACGRSALSDVDELAFHPWNAPEQFRPLGSLNRVLRFFCDLDRR